MRAADVLVNIGNTVQNQMPSKLWEYIATGKPILGVCLTRECNTLPYLTQYPNQAIVFADEADQEPAVQRAVDFCVSKAGTVLSWPQVSSVFPEQQSAFVARRFADALRAAESRQIDKSVRRP